MELVEKASKSEPITEALIRSHYKNVAESARLRLAEFRAVWARGDDKELFGEMAFCFFTGGCSAKMGIRSLEAIRPLLLTGTEKQLAKRLVGAHRFPNARARYVFETREFLKQSCGLAIRDTLLKLDHEGRREWLVKEKRIKGLAYKEASHFLRNIGLSGYGILDKHILNCLAELKLISDPKPPKNGKEYQRVENILKNLADRLNIDFDEMDLVLWSLKTGEILK
ncbi:MAG: hypothetical protein R2684_13325 [Pyrinomonadaceae bacterium]